MNRKQATNTSRHAVILLMLVSPIVKATELHVEVLSNGNNTVQVLPGTVVDYEIVGQLSDTDNEGLARLLMNLEFSGGPLPQANAPDSFPMTNFATPAGLNNPDGFGGTIVNGELRQVGGAQNTINNKGIVHPIPIGEVTTGVGHSSVVLLTGSLEAPLTAGSYTLQVSSFSGAVIRQGEDGSDFWRTDRFIPGSIGALTIDVMPAARPNPNTELGLGGVANGSVGPVVCNDTTDCAAAGLGSVPNIDCIPSADGTFPGTCYVSASRYLSIAPNPDNTSPTARRVSLDINNNDAFDSGVDHVLGWMADPFAVSITGPEPPVQAQARIAPAPVYRDWNDLSDVDAALVGVVPVHLGACEIAPAGALPASVGNVYFIQSIKDDDDVADESNYSAPLRLRTSTRSGDVAGGGMGSNWPNDGVSLLDAFAIVQGFQGVQSAPKWRLEQTGGQQTNNVPDLTVVNLLDVFDTVSSFQSGGDYAFEQPCDCPGQACP